MRVVIAEDESLLRQGLRFVLEDGGFTVVGAYGDAAQLLRGVDELMPDLVVTDIRMPPKFADEGLRAAIDIRRRHPLIGVVVLSQYVQRRSALELLGGNPARVGYLLKQRIANLEDFHGGLRRVAEGGTALDPEIIALLLTRAGRREGGVRTLTPRQREVLQLMAEGRSNSWIAAELVLTEKAIVQHTSKIYEALGLPVAADGHRRVLAVIRYLEGAVS